MLFFEELLKYVDYLIDCYLLFQLPPPPPEAVHEEEKLYECPNDLDDKDVIVTNNEIVDIPDVSIV